MLNIWEGTYLWIWYANQIQGGNLNAMLAQAKSLGITGVLIKFADGDLVNDPVSQGFMQQFKALVGPFKNAGLKVGGWMYQYLTDPVGEVDACSQAIEAGADWIVLDAEVDVYGKHTQVQQFGQMLRSRYPSIPIGLSSFAISNYHTQVPYTEYAAFTNVMMPQMYWADIGWDVAVTFHASLASYQQFGKPIAPTGQAYGTAVPADMQRFEQLAKQAKLTGISWWDWQHATSQQLHAIEQNILQPTSPTVQPSKNTIAVDVASSSWYAPAVAYVLQNKIMTVDASGHFDPEQVATRAQVAQVLLNEYIHNMLQLPILYGQVGTGTPIANPTSAKDVKGTEWYAKAVPFVLANGLMHLDANGNFNPNEPATRAQIAQVVYNEHAGYRTQGTTDTSTNPTTSTRTSTSSSTSNSTTTLQPTNAKDVAPSSWYSAAVQYVLQQGIMHLDAMGSFYPDQPATRAELAQVVFNEHNERA